MQLSSLVENTQKLAENTLYAPKLLNSARKDSPPSKFKLSEFVPLSLKVLYLNRDTGEWTPSPERFIFNDVGLTIRIETDLKFEPEIDHAQFNLSLTLAHDTENLDVPVRYSKIIDHEPSGKRISLLNLYTLRSKDINCDNRTSDKIYAYRARLWYEEAIVVTSDYFGIKKFAKTTGKRVRFCNVPNEFTRKLSTLNFDFTNSMGSKFHQTHGISSHPVMVTPFEKKDAPRLIFRGPVIFNHFQNTSIHVSNGFGSTLPQATDKSHNSEYYSVRSTEIRANILNEEHDSKKQKLDETPFIPSEFQDFPHLDNFMPTHGENDEDVDGEDKTDHYLRSVIDITTPPPTITREPENTPEIAERKIGFSDLFPGPEYFEGYDIDLFGVEIFK
jgi:hypothetical protein